jgi:hypothetical protein
MSLLSLFRRQRPAADSAGRGIGINGLQGSPEMRSEHDPVRRSASQTVRQNF